MNYIEFRDYFCEFFRFDIVEKGTETYFTMPRFSDDKNWFSGKSMREIYDKLENFSFDQATMYNNKYMEVILENDSRNSLLFNFRNDQDDECLKLNDDQNGISYEISTISPELLVYLIKRTIEKIFLKKEQKRVDSRFFNSLRNMSMHSSYNERNSEEFEDLSIIDFLFKSLRGRFVSLKITSDKNKSFESFVNLKNGYIFNTMYSTDKVLNDCVEFDLVLFYSRTKIDRTIQQLEVAPLKTYNGDIINYYKKAMSSIDPYIQYISFYHVLEYFYDETYFRYLVKDMREKITHPDFSYKNDEELLKLAKFAQNRLRQFGEDGQGNELESLKYVLKEFIDISDLKNKLSVGDVNYYSCSKVTFSDGPVVTFEDENGFGPIAKRIYFTRNSLVHSKSGKKDLTYHPYNHEEILKKEVPLIKKIAEMTIINSASLI
ncbi:TPA: hypothetical protein ACR6KW_002043 [Enterococcus faecalis]|uniref:hypothetical protein n=1 Tax=Enterococcus sp. DIV1059_1 TaxID=2774902 RepID=UPI00226FF517|nr:hypothetical protein [Enterococcus faecalis]